MHRFWATRALYGIWQRGLREKTRFYTLKKDIAELPSTCPSVRVQSLVSCLLGLRMVLLILTCLAATSLDFPWWGLDSNNAPLFLQLAARGSLECLKKKKKCSSHEKEESTAASTFMTFLLIVSYLHTRWNRKPWGPRARTSNTHSRPTRSSFIFLIQSAPCGGGL